MAKHQLEMCASGLNHPMAWQSDDGNNIVYACYHCNTYFLITHDGKPNGRYPISFEPIKVSMDRLVMHLKVSDGS